MYNKILSIAGMTFTVFINLLSTTSLAQMESQTKINQYNVVDTGQREFFNNYQAIPKPSEGQPFYGQDAQYIRNAPSYYGNSDGTITDLATGLVWQKTDSKKAMSWEGALSLAQKRNKEKYLGHSDWRLPNAKELQSIVDYSRSPQKTNSAAINPLFEVSEIIDEGGKTNWSGYLGTLLIIRISRRRRKSRKSIRGSK